MNLVVQEDPQGCGVACIASLLRISYKNALKLFQNGKKRATLEGFYCRDLICALEKKETIYTYQHIKGFSHKNFQTGMIVYIRRSKKYWRGHFLLKSDDGWMNPWFNFPYEPRIAKFQKKLPGKAQYVLYPV